MPFGLGTLFSWFICLLTAALPALCDGVAARALWQLCHRKLGAARESQRAGGDSAQGRLLRTVPGARWGPELLELIPKGLGQMDMREACPRAPSTVRKAEPGGLQGGLQEGKENIPREAPSLQRPCFGRVLWGHVGERVLTDERVTGKEGMEGSRPERPLQPHLWFPGVPLKSLTSCRRLCCLDKPPALRLQPLEQD